MAKAKPTEPKVTLEREYIVPLRSEWLKVPKHKRANRAVKSLKKFLARHMKVYDRDLRRIKIDELLNNEIRFRGMKKPPAKIKVNVKKFDNGIVRVYLVNLPENVKFKLAREEKKKVKVEGKKEKVFKKEEKEEDKDKKSEEKDEKKKEDEKEKKESSKEEGIKLANEQAKMLKHTSKDKNVIIQRKSLSR